MPFILSDIFIGNYRVSQAFGNNPKYIGGKYYPNGYYSQFKINGIPQRGHEGTDWATPSDVIITAPFNGIILRQDFQIDYKGYGRVVVVWNPAQKCAVWFCHLSVENINSGDRVIKGQPLGKTGATGNTFGAHLHFNLCATDQWGNRINRLNGYGGFINCIDRNNVTWILT